MLNMFPQAFRLETICIKCARSKSFSFKKIPSLDHDLLPGFFLPEFSPKAPSWFVWCVAGMMVTDRLAVFSLVVSFQVSVLEGVMFFSSEAFFVSLSLQLSFKVFTFSGSVTFPIRVLEIQSPNVIN